MSSSSIVYWNSSAISSAFVLLPVCCELQQARSYLSFFIVLPKNEPPESLQVLGEHIFSQSHCCSVSVPAISLQSLLFSSP